MNDTVPRQIRSFIVNNFLYGASDNGPDYADSFLEKGIIDSTGVLELVAFIEETYSIELDDEELIPENLDSIANVTAYLQKKGVQVNT